MEKFISHTGTGVPLRRSNVDTDQIIPAVYLKRVTRSGFEDGLFAAWRNDPEFVLNQVQYKSGTVLVAGPEFGTGSSREHAVWALQNYGFKVVISSRFADIFRGNSLKGGLLTVILPQAAVEAIWLAIEADSSTEIKVDLDSRTVATHHAEFSIHLRFLQHLDCRSELREARRVAFVAQRIRGIQRDLLHDQVAQFRHGPARAHEQT